MPCVAGRMRTPNAPWSTVCGVVSAVRSVRARYGVSPKQELAVTVKAAADKDIAFVRCSLNALIESLARVSVACRLPRMPQSLRKALRRLLPAAKCYCEPFRPCGFQRRTQSLAKELEKLSAEIGEGGEEAVESGLFGEGNRRNHREGQGEARRARGEARSSGKPDCRACLNGIAPKERLSIACRILCDGHDRKTRSSGRVFRCRRLFRRMALFSGASCAMPSCDVTRLQRETGRCIIESFVLFAKGPYLCYNDER